VTLELGPGHELDVEIFDDSGLLTHARAGSEPELTFPPDNSRIVAANPSSKPGETVALTWIGSICDREAALTIGPKVGEIVVEQEPPGSCDSAAVGRGLALTFASAIDALTIETSLHTASR
jgi:hypothetical protein